MNPHLAESVSFMVASTETDYGRLAPSPKSQLGLLTGALSRSPVGGSAAVSAVVPLFAGQEGALCFQFRPDPALG